jgi:Family of unknown function (DUF6283)
VIREPARSPCGSCPYRRNVPAGVWAAEEYAKLPAYDNPTAEQPFGVFMCHQQDDRACAGWAGCHDMRENLALRLNSRHMTREVFTALLKYRTVAPLFNSGRAAAEHGLSGMEHPDRTARRVIDRITERREKP